MTFRPVGKHLVRLQRWGGGGGGVEFSGAMIPLGLFASARRSPSDEMSKRLRSVEEPDVITTNMAPPPDDRLPTQVVCPAFGRSERNNKTLYWRNPAAAAAKANKPPSEKRSGPRGRNAATATTMGGGRRMASSDQAHAAVWHERRGMSDGIIPR